MRSLSRSRRRERLTSSRRADSPGDADSASRLLALLQLLRDLLFIRHLAELMHVDVANDPRGVDNDDRALGSPDLLVEHTVCLRHFAVRPEVAAHRVLDPTQRVGPGFEGVDAVA